MQNRWNESEAAPFLDDPLGLRVYTSRLLGQEPQLVLHGGGNTSVKTTETEFFGNEVDVLYVKGSGWNLETIEAAGFAPERLEVLKELAKCDSLSDSDMVEQQRLALLDSKAPNASVEAILHAIIPFRYVDHTHANAILALSNTANGEERIRDLYGERVIVIPYVMPGFALAKLVFEMTRNVNWKAYEGMILMNHGIFTFSDSARESYERMIGLVGEAENYLEERNAIRPALDDTFKTDLHALAKTRRQASELRGRPLVVKCDQSPEAVGYANLPNIADCGLLGPLTPDHSIFAKRIPALIGKEPSASITAYANEYTAYFERNAKEGMTCLDQAPRWAIWPERGIVSFGFNAKNAAVISDIARHTSQVVQMSEALGGWVPLSESDVFEVEYWELEQAKLKSSKALPPLQGRIIAVADAGSPIGQACVKRLLDDDAAVIALGSSIGVADWPDSSACLKIACDLEDAASVDTALQQGILEFGGLDAIVSIPSSLEAHSNLLAAGLPFLRWGIDPSLLIIESASSGIASRARSETLRQAPEKTRVGLIDPHSGLASKALDAPVCAATGTVEFHRNSDLPLDPSAVADIVATLAGSFGALKGTVY